MSNPTPRQMQYLLMKAHGLADKQVARRSRVTEQAVKNQLLILRRHIGARTTAHAVYLLWPVLEAMLESERWYNESNNSNTILVENADTRLLS